MAPKLYGLAALEKAMRKNMKQKKGRKNKDPSFTYHVLPIDPDWEAQTGIYAPGAGITPARPSSSTAETPSTAVLESVSAPLKAKTSHSSLASTKTKTKIKSLSTTGIANVAAKHSHFDNQKGPTPASASKAVEGKGEVHPSSTSTGPTPAMPATKASRPPIPITLPLQNIQATVVPDSVLTTIRAQKLCASCRAAFPANLPYKRCNLCREKGRERSRMKHLKAAAAKAALPPIDKDKVDSQSPIQDSEAQEAGIEPSSTSSTHAVGQKRKTSDIEPIETSTKPKKTKKSKVDEFPVTEYQTADGLYQDLKTWSTALQVRLKASITPSIEEFNFSGTFSIVMDTTVDHASQLDSIISDLKVHIKIGDELVSKRKTLPRHSKTVKCKCKACLLTPSRCAGNVEITVGADMSHPFIPGQKIDIRVRHRIPI
ncbi:hypothetical protein BJ165DRAFT_1611266 [Panaeolus papilionaceus]|nr:hypothetical protein BJ165DRAFT_1611266 [Panaeolus papilionaceus]